ncbi:MAG: nitrous oxide-stimulated promoter family protein [Thermincola sp.]|nr:nitrous oxide-stimulated promoter family protein [Thermincola sp.]MDT3703101.1 nitrous oxide-stimulated promoter family protein [Thermincola sp.]
MTNKRIAREKKTIEKMLNIYCKDKHSAREGLCSSCQELYQYALQRLDRCKFQENKPTCEKCPIHCYRKDMRQQVREAMKYAGSRMIFKHPVAAIYHIVDNLSKVHKD